MTVKPRRLAWLWNSKDFESTEFEIARLDCLCRRSNILVPKLFTLPCPLLMGEVGKRAWEQGWRSITTELTNLGDTWWWWLRPHTQCRSYQQPTDQTFQFTTHRIFTDHVAIYWTPSRTSYRPHSWTTYWPHINNILLPCQPGQKQIPSSFNLRVVRAWTWCYCTRFNKIRGDEW